MESDDAAAQPTGGPLIRSWTPPGPYDLRRTLAIHRFGAHDPCQRVDVGGAVWRAMNSPAGPVVVRWRVLSDVAPGADGPAVVEQSSWGPGAAWAADRMPEFTGAVDDPTALVPVHSVVRDAARTHAGLRLSAGGAVIDPLIATILAQKVTVGEATSAWSRLVRAYGQALPMDARAAGAPDGLCLPPAADRWSRIPSWEFHRAGVGPERAATILRAARAARALQAAVPDGPDALHRRLLAVPGIGPWTSAEVRQRVLGDADAVSVGDFHVPRMVVFALEGTVSDRDEDLLRVLEPYTGQRYRVQLLLGLAGPRTPRFGPRYRPLDHYGRETGGAGRAVRRC